MVIKLDSNYIDEVAQIHESIDPTSYLHEAGYGSHFKKAIFYRAVIGSKEASCFIYLADNRVVGFLVAAKDANRFYRYEILARHFLPFLRLTAMATLRNPRAMIGDFFNQLFAVSGFLKSDELAQIPGAMIAFGVLKEHRAIAENDFLVRPSVELMLAAAKQFKAWGARQFKTYSASSNKEALIFYLQRGGKISCSFNALNHPQIGLCFDTEEVIQRAQGKELKHA